MDDTGFEHLLTVGSLVSQRYLIERLLGQGGMGAVYLAADRVLGGQLVALKVLHREMVEDESLVKRFLREVELMHRVSHANVVRTFDVGVDGPVVYFTMEFVEGKPLDQILDEAEDCGELLQPRRIAGLGEQIAAGLAAIHAAGIVHRDLKPQNVLVLDDGSVKITDFGVARPSDSKLTKHSEILGSIHYIAPEVWLGQALTASIDLYALGVILYELTTGALPFSGDEPAKLMWMHSRQQPKPPRSLRADTPNWLNQLVLGLLQKQPTQRPKSAVAIREFLKANADNCSQLVRDPEMINGGESIPVQPALVIAPRAATVTDLSIAVPRPRRRPDAKRRHGWIPVLLALITWAVLIPTREICACTTMEDHLRRTLGVTDRAALGAGQYGPHIVEFVPGGLPRRVVDKKLSALAGTRPDRCRKIDPLTAGCRFELRKGLARAWVLEVTVEFNPGAPDFVDQVLVRDFTELFGHSFRAGG